jgi:hypothetical protein
LNAGGIKNAQSWKENRATLESIALLQVAAVGLEPTTRGL